MSQQPAAFTGDAATTSAANATSSATNTALFEAARAVIPLTQIGRASCRERV